MDRAKPPGIKIVQIFLEQVQFSHREDYLSLPHTTAANVGNVSVEVKGALSPDAKSGLVNVQVWTTPETKPIYNFRISMTALVTIDETAPNMSLDQYIRGSGPALLFPFARQIVADLTWRGRFGPVWLNPTNLLAVAAAAKPAEQLPKRASHTGRGVHRKKKAARR